MKTCPDCNTELGDLPSCIVCASKSPEDGRGQVASTGLSPENKDDSELRSKGRDETFHGEDPEKAAASKGANGQQHGQPVIASAEAEDITIVQGPVTFNKEINHYYREFQKEKGEEEFKESRLSFIEASAPLPPRRALPAEAPPPGFGSHLNLFRESHLVLLSCFDEELALDAAHLLIEGLDLNGPEAKRSLLFESLAPDRRDPSIHSFCFDTQAEQRTGIIIDGFSKRAETFVDSLLVASPTSADKISHDLKSSDLYLVCLIDPARIDRSADTGVKLRFTHWRIPHAPRPPSQEAPDLMKMYDEGDPAGRSVLYAAVFFPDLTLTEFNRVVTLMLSHEEADNTHQSKDQPWPAEGESAEKTLTQVDKPPSKLWRDNADSYRRRFQLGLTPSKLSRKVIGFSQPGVREKLAERWPDELPFDLDNRLKTVRDLGLLLDPSGAVAKNARTLIAEEAAADPDSFDPSWLVNVLRHLNSRVHGGGLMPFAPDFKREVELLGRAGAGRPNAQLYTALADLLRQMLGYAQLKKVAGGILEQLMRDGAHRAVLALVKRLQYALNFDEFYWLKQLLERAERDPKLRTYLYLNGYLKNAENDIYEILSKLKSWLPPADRDPDTYPQHSRAVLEIFSQYCIESVFEFKEEYYGLWPSRYPLFDFNDAGTAGEHLGLLAEWLTHPGMQAVLLWKETGDDYHRFLGALLAQWAFILRGNDESGPKPARETGASDVPTVEAAASFGPDDVLIALLRQIILNTDAALHKQLVAYWDELKADFNRILDDFSLHGSSRKIVLSHRRLTVRLTEKFKEEMRRLKAQQSSRS